MHDWLTGMRGGERCLEVFCELFPDAPLFTLLHVPGSVSPLIERRRIVTSFVQRLPGAANRYRQYLPLFPAAVRGLSLAGHDLVISLSHCAAKAVRVPPGALHLCYCFTPMRYVWDLEDDYTRGAGWLTRAALPPLAAALRRWDRRTGGVHDFVAISRHIADRIRRVYGRDCRGHPSASGGRPLPAGRRRPTTTTWSSPRWSRTSASTWRWPPPPGSAGDCWWSAPGRRRRGCARWRARA